MLLPLLTALGFRYHFIGKASQFSSIQHLIEIYKVRTIEFRAIGSWGEKQNGLIQ